MLRILNIKGISERTGIAYDRLNNYFKTGKFNRLSGWEKQHILDCIEKEKEELKTNFEND